MCAWSFTSFKEILDGDGVDGDSITDKVELKMPT